MSDTDYGKRATELTADERLALFEQLRKQKKESTDITTQVIPRQNRDTHIFPLSFAQQRLWFLEQYEPDTSMYNIPEALIITGALNKDVLQKTLNAIIARHETLRTTFTAIDGLPMQVIADFTPIEIPCIDLRALPKEVREAEAMRMKHEEAVRPFQLAKGPLLRVALLQTEDTEYVLLLSMHHIISDGWSKGIFMRELITLYQAFLQSDATAQNCLPALPIQYADFAVWQRDRLQGSVLKDQLDYWREKLAEIPTLQLPTDHPRPMIASVSGAAAARRLSPELSQKLNAISRETKSSLFMVMLTAFTVLLMRYTSQDDIAVGTVIANRNYSDIENLIGFFVNTLVLRVDLSGKPTFKELLARVRDVCFGAYAHQDLPFEQLVEELQPKRDLSGNPLAQVTFILQNAPTAHAQLTDLVITPIETEIETSKFDLTVYAIESDGGMILDAEYKNALFEKATIERMLAHFEIILQAAMDNPDQSVTKIPLLTAAEQQLILHEWNTVSAQYPSNAAIHQLFERSAAATPDAIALACEGSQITYGALNARANQLAHYLRSMGAGPDVYVALSVERDLDLMVGILGILKSGSAYVPLDPNYPRERLSFILNDIDAPVLVTQQALLPQVPARQFMSDGVTPMRVVLLDSDWETIAQNSSENPKNSTDLQNIAYVIFTSGSTGTPKGVMITHQNVVRLFYATKEWYGYGANDIWSLFHSYAFDVSVWEMWGALLHGGKLIIIPRAVATAPESFYNVLVDECVTFLSQTPSAFRQIIQVEESLGMAKPLCLRYVVFGGEALQMLALQPWFNRHSDQSPKLINMYGITETTVHVTMRHVTEKDLLPPASSVIGEAMPDLSLYALDSALQPVPIGVIGELYVGGEGLARGYLHRPDLTSERFIANPFSAEPGARLYKSGDLVRYLPNGDMEYMGRIDHQVKVRGFRIELGEIEATLQQHPAVREAIVIARSDQSGSQNSAGDHNRLFAYVTRKQRQNTEDTETSESWFAEQTAHWQQVFDTIYLGPAEGDPTKNFIGWNSSYTNQPIPETEMQEWVNSIISRIRQLQPKRILEIGCGTGLMLFPLVQDCKEYVGTDFSPEVLANLRAQVERQNLPQVTLIERSGDDFSSPLAEKKGTFDAVIINSVVQYFPGVEYFLRVLEGAAQMLAPNGFIFAGDIRNKALLETFHTSVQLRQAPLTMLTEQLRQRIQKLIAQENELVVDPEFFKALPQYLPQISHAEILLKGGKAQNELTRFRYDVILHVNRQLHRIQNYTAINWKQMQLTPETLRKFLETEQPTYLVVKDIPNARIIADTTAVEILRDEDAPNHVGDLWQILRKEITETGVDPETFRQFSDSLPYVFTITWSQAPELFDLYCVRQNAAPKNRAEPLHVFQEETAPAPLKPWGAYTTNPMAAESKSNLAPELREYVKRRLPEYMIPSFIIVMDTMPLNNNGKIDRKALPSPDGSRPELKSAYVAPRNPAEQTLAEIWSELLGVGKIGVHDNFFELGGDSLMSIRVVAKASKSGLSITTKQVFQFQTIAELAAHSGSAQILTEQGLVTGAIHMMPPNRFILGPRMGNPYSYALSYILEGSTALNPALLEQTARQIIAHHDVLRMRAWQDQGEWKLSISDLDTSPSTWQIDLSGLSEVEQIDALQRIVREIMFDFDIKQEPLLRLALCDIGTGQPTPLVIAGHSLAVDMQSWQFLTEDIQTVYRQLSNGEPAQLPAKTTSLKQWNDRLQEYAHSPELLAELPYWLSEERKNIRRLPMDMPEGENTGPSLSMALDLFSLEETTGLQEYVSRKENLQIDTLLLAAAALTVMDWIQERKLLVIVEGHGRITDFDDIDLSRTLGALAMDYPLLLDFTNLETPEEIIRLAQTELKQLTHRGISYNALRRFSNDSDIVSQMEAMPQPEIFFNYLAGSVAPAISDYVVSVPYNGHLLTMDETTLQPLSLLVTGFIADGQLQVSWHYSSNQYHSETMERLATGTVQNLRVLFAQLKSGESR